MLPASSPWELAAATPTLNGLGGFSSGLMVPAAEVALFANLGIATTVPPKAEDFERRQVAKTALPKAEDFARRQVGKTAPPIAEGPEKRQSETTAPPRAGSFVMNPTRLN